MKSYKFIVKGKVQGVWYRKCIYQIACILKYNGYVKNLQNGDVEVTVNLKDESEVESFISKLYEGSMLSKVTKVEYSEVSYTHFSKFEVDY